MPAQLAGGVLVLSMDYERSGMLSTAETRSLVPFTRELLQLLGSYKATATFASTHVASCPAVEHVLADPAAHEVAMLVNRPASSSDVVLLQQTVRQAQAAQAAGYQISTLSLCGGMKVADVELARRLGFSAVRSCGPAPGRDMATKRSLLDGLFRALRCAPPQSAAARPVKHGLVEVPVTLAAPNADGQFSGPTSLQAMKRVVQLAGDSQQTMQLAFDVAGLMANSNKSLVALEHLLKQAAALRTTGLLQIATVSAVAAKALKQRQTAPARSILRRAA